MNNRRKQSIFYLALSILGIVLLAAGLQDLTFESGLPIPGADPTHLSPATSADPASAPANTVSFLWLLQGALAIGSIVLLFIFLITLFQKTSKKRIGFSAAGLALLVLLFFWLPRITSSLPVNTAQEPSTIPEPSFVFSLAPIGNPPNSLFWLVLVGLIIATAWLGIWLFLQSNQQAQKEDRLELEAAAAIQAISEGQNIKNVIIRCYLQMERVIQEERGFERQESVTPREFERSLIARGIPDTAVVQLTRLFETVRYGEQLANEMIEQEAIDCLLAIRAACRSVKGKSA